MGETPVLAATIILGDPLVVEEALISTEPPVLGETLIFNNWVVASTFTVGCILLSWVKP